MQEAKQWTKRYNQELNRLYQSLDIIVTITVARLQWAGLLQRTGNNEIPTVFSLKRRRRMQRYKLFVVGWCNGRSQETVDPKVVNGSQ